ncbi:UDP-N-acetylmuramoyl-L-alanine--D-glutamate ligase [Lachnospiraceae bacterium LCP25S3_G4]
MELKNKCVLVFGSGISGIGACQLLDKVGAHVILYDGNESLDVKEIKQEIGLYSQVEIVLGTLRKEIMNQIELVVLSPGVPTDLEILEKIRTQGIPIWGEVELAYRYAKGDLLAVTGTNGKTTTTALLGEIMSAWKEHVHVVGNIGNSYTKAAIDMDEDAITVAELSSFQLESIQEFHPKVSAILNISPDHLNRHHTLEAYIEAKKAIAKNQTEQDMCVLNYENEVTREFGEKVKANVLYFSSQRKLDKGIYLEEGNIIYRNGDIKCLCHVDELQLLGNHNFENVMAASAMAIAYGTPIEVVKKAIKAFGGVEHRIEYVCEKNGVVYYNDSKGTNPDAAIKGIQAMKRKTLLIGGGYDKDSDYEEWINAFDGKVKKLVLLGATREKIRDTAIKLGFDDCILVDTFEEAVEACVTLALPGEAVLLSPACASWGMFQNYEERGDKFKELVNRL